MGNPRSLDCPKSLHMSIRTLCPRPDLAPRGRPGVALTWHLGSSPATRPEARWRCSAVPVPAPGAAYRPPAGQHVRFRMAVISIHPSEPKGRDYGRSDRAVGTAGASCCSRPPTALRGQQARERAAAAGQYGEASRRPVCPCATRIRDFGRSSDASRALRGRPAVGRRPTVLDGSAGSREANTASR
jgi:hypothetical protein